MATLLEEGDLVPDNQQIRFIEGVKKGSKVLLFEDNIFHVDRKSGQSTIYKCAQSKWSGCRARVKVHKVNPVDYTFESFEVIDGARHNQGHLPNTAEKTRGKDETTAEKSVRERGFKGTKNSLENCRHICLFCCDDLPDDYRNAAYLQDVGPDGDNRGHELIITLDDPVKNADAFQVLCNRLDVNWRNDGSGFDDGAPLPLCYKCQALHQQLLQLHVQIGQLEKLIGEHVGVIRSIMTRTDEEGGRMEEEVGGPTQLELWGLEEFRKRVISAAGGTRLRRRNKKSVAGLSRGQNKKSEGVSSPRAALTNESTEDDIFCSSPPELNYEIIKQEAEAFPPPDDISADEYIIYREPQWMERAVIGGKVEAVDSNLNVAADPDNSVIDGNDDVRNDDHDDLISEELSEEDNDSDFEIPKSSKKSGRQRSAPKSNLNRFTKSRKSEGVPNRREYSCHICPSVLLGQYSLISHYKTAHPEENRYTCKFCQKHFRERRACIRHQRNHTGETPFHCTVCPKSFRDGKLLRIHQRTHSNPPLKCPTCGKGYWIQSKLSTHMLIHKDDSVILCKSCGISFKHEGTFRVHNLHFHNGQAEHSQPITKAESLSSEALASLGVNPETPGPPRTKCHLCWQRVLGRSFLEKHFQETHPDHRGGVTTCRCGKGFKQYKECVKHALRHSEERKSFQCDQCPRSFFTAKELRLHGASHVPLELRRAHVCDVCGVGLASPVQLAIHRRKHDERGPRLVCETCGKSYADRKGLRFHVRKAHLKNT